MNDKEYLQKGLRKIEEQANNKLKKEGWLSVSVVEEMINKEFKSPLIELEEFKYEEGL